MVLVGPRLAAALCLLALAAFPVSASLSEDVSDHEVSYQFDGDGHHDAPDTCETASPEWSLAPGASTDGMLTPPDDPSDVFQLDVSQAQVGTRLRVAVSEATGSADVLLSLLAPGCDGDVFALRNQPTPPPAPPAPAATQVQASLPRAAAPYQCGSSWYFAATDLRTGAPANLYAAWTDGSRGNVPLAFTWGNTAVYGPASASVLLEGAWVNLPATWHGSFVLAQAPCAAPDGGAVYGQPALLGDDWISFTPIRAGPHEIVVRVAPTLVQPPPSAVPASCHWCVDGLDQVAAVVSYDLFTQSFAAQA